MAKAELQSLKQMQQAATQQDELDAPATEQLSGAFGRGFLRSEELREALQVKEFVDEYKEKIREQERRERFKVAYAARVASDRKSAERKKREQLAVKARVDSINARRLAEIRAKARTREAEGRRGELLGRQADTVVMRHDATG